MTSIEARVARTAVDAGKHSRYEDVYEIVSAATRVPVDAVKEIVERLAAGGVVLLKMGGPSQNLAESGVRGAILAKAWYERGDRWPGDSGNGEA
jgi:hypothetical protein